MAYKVKNCEYYNHGVWFHWYLFSEITNPNKYCDTYCTGFGKFGKVYYDDVHSYMGNHTLKYAHNY